MNTTEIEAQNVETQQLGEIVHPLSEYSLRGKYDELVTQKLTQTYVLQGVALLGESTVLYAEHNTGKTLITFALLIEAIQSGRVQGDKVYYVNVDDSFNGAVDKLGFAQKHGFHYIARDQAGFSVERLRVAMVEMIESGTAKGTVLILDTLKKFVDLMDKAKSSKFADLVRSFVSKGGTVIALAHTNKNRGADGRPQYGGTSDIISDFDCAFIMSATDAEGQSGLKLVEFANQKARGPVEKYAYCTYPGDPKVPYADKLAAVRLIPEEELAEMKRKAGMARDADAIAVITDCISSGVTQKMALIKAVRDQTGLSRGTVAAVLDTYVGTDKERHLWSVRVGARGAKIYSPLQPSVEHVDRVSDDF